ncbi:MAG: hypothetical protein V3U22_04205, partial [Vicinamibacteria bacterium]
VLISRDWSLSGILVSDFGVAVRLLLIAALGMALYRLSGWRDGYSLLLLLLMLLSVYQFHSLEKRMVSDGFNYFAYVRSFWKDFDVNFENDYRLLGIADRHGFEVPTRTGHRRSIFSAGPAVFWSPFFLLGELYGRLAAWSGQDVNLKGNGPFHWNAVAVGSMLYGFIAVFLLQSLLRRYFDTVTAFAATLLIWFGTPLHWYIVYQPWMSHALGTFTAVLFIWSWDRSRLQREWKNAFALGLLGGLMVCVRWQNGVLLFLPLFDWLWAMWRRDRAVLGAGPILFAGFLIGLSPQLLAWKAIYGEYLLVRPPHGAGFVGYSNPFVFETLFSSRHGLLSWTPLLWLGFLGLIPLLRRRWTTVWMMTFCLVLMTYVNMCIMDWWAGGSFSNRRFDGALPIFAFGVAASFDYLRGLVSRRPAWAAATLLAFFPMWTMLLMEQYHRHQIPIDGTVSFTKVVGNSAEILFETVGYPFAWPANWWFASVNDTSPAKFDTVVGRYLFFPNRFRSEVIEVGEEDGALMGREWASPELRSGRWVRVTRRTKARVFIPMGREELLRLSFSLSVRPDPVEVVVAVNESEIGRFLATPGFSEYPLSTPAVFPRGINTLSLQPQFQEARQILLLDRVTFDRVDR